ncbi:spore coat U domain-containing protein [Pseudomonas sp. NPDC090202]|uniref:Csu type fimbrial protein n=1 Tax=unclassified Pseudomonas TaxID=196821 RepID=UPI00380CE7FC
MKHLQHTVVALASLLPLADSAHGAITGHIDARLIITAACEVSAGGGELPGSLGELDFGNQGPTWNAPLSSRLSSGDGALNVTCNPSVKGFTVTIDGGTHGDGSIRRLSNGRQTIPYRLSVDAAGLDTYSIGQQRTFAVSDGTQRPIPVYGVVVANTSALPAGVYSDTLTVTLDW